MPGMSIQEKKRYSPNYLTMPDREWLSKLLYSSYSEEMERIRIPKFDYEKAFEIGTLTRISAQDEFPGKPVVIDISLRDGHSLFRMTTGAGSLLDDDKWIESNQETAMNFECSSFSRANRFREAMSCKDPLQSSLNYKQHAYDGGALPLFIESCEFPVACLTVSGLSRMENQWLVVESLKDYVKKLDSLTGKYSKYTASGRHGAQCAICSATILSYQYDDVTLCNHVFHVRCLNYWKDYNSKCPVCLTPLSPP